MSKRAIISKVFQDVRASYWFVPSLFAVGAMLLAQGSLALDRFAVDGGFALPDAWRTTQVEGARSTLSVIAQSMIGVSGVLFSITIVAVSFASGNFGPRLIGNFMRDRGTQITLGILIGTFVFALFALRAVQSPFDDTSGSEVAAFVPHMSLVLALGMTLTSIFAMIFYIHHVPELINVSNISATLGRKLKSAIRERITSNQEIGDGPPWPGRPDDHKIESNGAGYIQTWDKATMVTLARDHDLFIELPYETGDFVSESSTLLHVWSDMAPEEGLTQALRDCFALGKVPTETQNLYFIVDQLVEMIARALSPGVNDPFTAINCLNWLYVGCVTAGNFEGGLVNKVTPRVKSQAVTFENLLTRTFAQGADYIMSDKLARDHLADLLDRLSSELVQVNHRQSVETLRRHVFAEAQ